MEKDEYLDDSNQQYLLSNVGFPVSVTARSKDVLIEPDTADPVPLGSLEPEGLRLVSATIYFKDSGDYFSSYATIELVADSELGQHFDEMMDWLQKSGKAQLIEGSSAFACIGADGTPNLTCIQRGDDAGDSNVILVYPRSSPDISPTLSNRPSYFRYDEDEKGPDELVMDIGRGVADVVNCLYFAAGTPHKATMEIALPGAALQQREIIKAFDGGPVIIEHEAELVPIKHPEFPSFEDFGGLDAEIERLKEIVSDAQIPPALWEEYGLQRSNGIMLIGPGGVGKTELSKALAKELQADYHYVRTSDILTPWVGEPGQLLRKKFEKAQKTKGLVVLFFDEFDGLFSSSAGGNDGGARSLVAEMKIQMTAIEQHPNVIVVTAANSTDGIDPALLRAGRFDTVIKIPEPNSQSRKAIFEKLLYKHEDHFDVVTMENLVENPVNTAQLAEMAIDFTGSDITTVLKKLLRQRMRTEHATGTRPARISQAALELAIAEHRSSRSSDS